MRSPSSSTDARCFQQTCLSPHCWHRVVKSCLHCTLRSRKTDKLVSKRTTKSPNKEPFVFWGFSWKKAHIQSSLVHTWGSDENLFSSRTFLCLSVVRVPSLSYWNSSSPNHPPTMCAFCWTGSCQEAQGGSPEKKVDCMLKNNVSTPGPVKDMWQELRTRNLEVIQESVNKWLYMSVDVYSAWKPFLQFLFFALPMQSQHKSAAKSLKIKHHWGCLSFPRQTPPGWDKAHISVSVLLVNTCRCYIWKNNRYLDSTLTNSKSWFLFYHALLMNHVRP